MKKTILNILIFILIIGISDYLLGLCFTYMRKNSGSGNIQSLEYCINKSKDDIFVFGSSRAVYHYVPKVITDSLSMTCYNCGREGMGIIYLYGLWQLISSHHTPKIILYDYSRFDTQNDDPLTYLSDLRPFYDESLLSSYFKDLDFWESIKDKSYLYRYNSKIIQLIRGMIQKRIISDGFKPLQGELQNYIKGTYKSDVDSLKYHCMEEFIKQTKAKGTHLIFFISPYYDGYNHTYPSDLITLFNKYGIKHFDNQDIRGFTFNKKYFKDRTHLNKKGATEYTHKIISQIKESI